MGFIEWSVFGGVVENLDVRVRRTRYLDMHHPLVVARYFQARQKNLGIVRCMDLQAVCCLCDFRIRTFSDIRKTARPAKIVYSPHPDQALGWPQQCRVGMDYIRQRT